MSSSFIKRFLGPLFIGGSCPRAKFLGQQWISLEYTHKNDDGIL